MTQEKQAGRLPLHIKIFLGMGAGALLGLAARFILGEGETLSRLVSGFAQPVGQIFLRIIFMAVVPLVVAAVALGVAEIKDVARFGRIGLLTLALTLVFSGVAVLIGVSAANLFRPGTDISPDSRAKLLSLISAQAPAAKPAAVGAASGGFLQGLADAIPKNPLASAVNAFEGGLLPLMVFAVFLGLAISASGAKGEPVKNFLASLFELMLKIISFAMKLAPFGVAGLLFSVTATVGLEALGALGRYTLVVLGALAVQLFVFYPVALRLLARTDPVKFFRGMKEVMLTAFATSSSSATLPLTLKTAVEKLGLPKEISYFVLTVGATANQNGTALYEGVTVLFLAQFFGVDLTLAQQTTVVLMSIMAGIGTAGVPGGSLPLVMAVLNSIGVPGEGIVIILGIDRLLDMARTVLNVTGDMTIAACVAKLESRSALSKSQGT